MIVKRSLFVFLLCIATAGIAQNRVWGTYFGGNHENGANSVATDKWGNVYITGRTDSTLYTTPGCHQSVYGGDNDFYIAKFNQFGLLQWSTYYGGDQWETEVYFDPRHSR